MEPIHFFRPGRHVAMGGREMVFSARDLNECAAAYSPGRSEAPIVVGHPTMNGPAYGWVKEVIAKPDGLYAVPHQMNPAFADVVRQGAYKKVSGAFYAPEAPTNPCPGKYYLRHVGFLGATAPAIKGLREVQFADEEEILCFSEDPSTLREHRFAMQGYEIRERELSAREVAFAEREATMRAAERRMRQDADAATVAAAVHGGRLPKGLAPLVIAIFADLTDEVIAFGEGEDAENASTRDLMCRVLAALPQPVTTGELAGGDWDLPEYQQATPAGYKVDPDGLAQFADVQTYQRQHKVTFEEAILAVLGKKQP